jgi:hypothetical protein
MSHTVKSGMGTALVLTLLGLAACARTPAHAATGGVAQVYGADAGGVPSPMPNSPLYDAGAAPVPLPSAPAPSSVPGVPSPGLPPGTPTNPGAPSQPGLPPIP